MSESAPPRGETYEDLVDAYEAEEFAPPVIPVTVVDSVPVHTMAARTWATGRPELLAGQTVCALQPHPARSSVVLVAEDADVYAHADPAMSAAGLLLPVGVPITMGHREAVYLTNTGAASGVVTWAAEYLDG